MSSMILQFRSRWRDFHDNVQNYIVFNFLFRLIRTFYILYFPRYLIEIGYVEDRLGSFMAVSTGAMAVLSIAGGMISDRIGRRKSLLFGITISKGVFFARGFFTALPALYFAYFVNGAFGSLFWATRSPFLYENTSSEERDHALSMNSIVLRGAGIFGNIFGGYLPYMIRFFRPELGDVAVYRTIFAISWVVMAIAVYQLFKLEDTEGREVEEEKELEQELEANGEREDLRARKQQQEDELDLSTAGPMTRFLHYLEIPLESARFLVKYIMAEGLLALGAGFFLPFMTMYFIRIFDASYEAVGWIRSFSQLMVITGLALVPWLSKRFGTVNSIFATRLIAVPLILGIAYAPNLWWVAAAFALRNTFQRMGQPLRQKFMMGNLDREKRATATGVHRTVGRVFRAVAVGTAGLVITRLSYTTAFWIGFGAYGVSCLLFYLFFVRDEEYRNYSDRKKMMDRVASG